MKTVDLIALARTYIGHPYRHQGRDRHGLDCGGFVRELALAAGIEAPDMTGYSRQPDGVSMQALCDRSLTPAKALAVGQIALMHFGGAPQHLALIADYKHGGLSMIHADSRRGAVVEHRLTTEWRRHIVRSYSIPGLE